MIETFALCRKVSGFWRILEDQREGKMEVCTVNNREYFPEIDMRYDVHSVVDELER